MKSSKLNQVILGSLNILVATGAMAQGHVISSNSNVNNDVVKLNNVSLKSIESSWLQVPAMCKARGFNASPVAVENINIDSNILNIYSKFGV